MYGNYTVTIGNFAEKHFIKSFQKKYKKQWEVTLRAIIAEFERIDNLLKTDRAETIVVADHIKIIKTKFKVAGTQDSARSSGNRCIVMVNESKKCTSILLVYGKTDLDGVNETKEWIKLVKENYPQLRDMI